MQVPLPAVHHFRESLSEHETAGAAHSLWCYRAGFDPPVIASCVKLRGIGVESAVGVV